MLTVVVANVTPEEAAEHYGKAGLSGTAVASVGFGAWGVERGTRIEFGSASETLRAMRATERLLIARDEACAFTSWGRAVLDPGRPNPRWVETNRLLYADGRVEDVA